MILALHKEQLKKMDKNGWSNLTEAIGAFKTDAGTMNWSEVANRVDELLVDSGEDVLVTSRLIYDSLYRGESLFNIHGGLGVLQGHVQVGNDVTVTVERRDGPAYQGAQVKPAASLVGLLSIMVAGRIGFDDAELLRLHKRVLGCGAEN
jgi:hypothetical protein